MYVKIGGGRDHRFLKSQKDNVGKYCKMEINVQHIYPCMVKICTSTYQNLLCNQNYLWYIRLGFTRFLHRVFKDNWYKLKHNNNKPILKTHSLYQYCWIAAWNHAPHPTKGTSPRVTATTIRISIAIMSENIKYILLPCIPDKITPGCISFFYIFKSCIAYFSLISAFKLAQWYCF